MTDAVTPLVRREAALAFLKSQANALSAIPVKKPNQDEWDEVLKILGLMKSTMKFAVAEIEASFTS